jgi:outer membrane protein assembly factor BamB
MNNAKTTAGLLLGCFLLLGAKSAWAQDWPQWRGPNRDNKVTGFTEPKTWPKELTKKWSTKVGVGDASPILVGDKVYVFTREGGDEVIRCLDAEKGMEVWNQKYKADPAKVPMGGHTGPRSSPVVADGKVVAFGVQGMISCWDAATGKPLWQHDTKEHPQFYTGASPIVVDGKVIVHIGGSNKGTVVAYDLASGEEKWKWTGDGAAYASPVVLTVDKSQQFVTQTAKGVVAIDVADGKLLWQAGDAARYHSVSPVVDGQTVYYGGENAGTIAAKIEKKDDKFVTTELWKKSTGPGKYNTPMLKDGLLYGITDAGKFYCMKAENGEVVWTDNARHGDCGGIFDAGAVLIALTSDKQLIVFKPGEKEFKEIAKYKVANTPTWALPIIAGNRVFVKDEDSVILWTIE